MFYHSNQWLNGEVVGRRTHNQASGRGFNSRWGWLTYYLDAWVTVCKQVNGIGKRSTTKVNSASTALVNRVLVCLAGVKVGTFTCVWLQVTLCDPICQATLRSNVIIHEEA